MTMQRTLSILGFACAATTGAACVTSASDAPAPDAGMDDPPPALPRSCQELLAANPALDSGTFTLGTAANTPYQAYCDMVDDGGGWTLVLKADGKDPSSQFGYDSPLWTNTAIFKDDQVDTSRAEAKYRSFTEVAFAKIRIVMVEAYPTAMALDTAGSSLMAVMRGPFVPLANSRAQWLGLLPGGVLQSDCNRGGINNFVNDPWIRVRIGLIANSVMNCDAPDSFIGIGGGGGGLDPCYTSSSDPFVPPSVGSIGGGVCTSTPAVPAPNRAAFAYVYVR
jgi:Fibrinogen beta and gamma chains, C-terminal globular domain